MAATRLLKKSDFAEKAGVSRPAVTKACGKVLKPAIVGNKIDIDHPAAIAYVKLHRKGKTSKKPIKKKTAKKKPIKKKKLAAKKKPGPEPEPQHVYAEDEAVEAYLDMTLRDILTKFGTAAQFKSYLDACKIIEAIRAGRIKNAELEGDLISRDLVKIHIFGAWENSNLRLLQDMPRTVTKRLQALFKSGGTLEDGEEMTRGLVSSQLKGIKTAAQRILGKED